MGNSKKIPQNEDLKDDIFKDKILRNLDCAAIEYMQGGPAFEGAGLFERTHIQICIRNPNCIQGFFMPREEIDFLEWLDKTAKND